MNHTKYNYSKIVYFLLYLWLGLSAVSLSTISEINSNVVIIFGKIVILVRISLMVLYVCNMFTNKIKIKDLFIFGFFMAVSALAYLGSDKWLLFDILFVAIFWGDKLYYKKILNMYYYVLITATLVIIALYFVGVLPDFSYERGNGLMRHSFGFSHPNTLGFILFVLSILYCLRKKVITFLDYILLIIIAVFTYVGPNSETCTACILLMGSYCFIRDNNRVKSFKASLTKQTKKKWQNIFISGSIIILIMLIYLVALRGAGAAFIAKISGTLYTRFRYGAYAIRQYGFSLWGQYIPMIGDGDILNGVDVSKYFTLDCLYFYLPIVIGLIPTAFFTLCYIHCMKISAHKGNKTLLAAAFITLVYSIAEVSAVTLFSAYLYILAIAQVNYINIRDKENMFNNELKRSKVE